MKFTKRFLSLTLALIMLVFTAVSCKKDNEENSDYNPYPYDDLGVFIKIPDYKSITVSQAHIDMETNLLLYTLYQEKNLYVEVTSGREAKLWDSVKLEFLSVVIDGTTVYPKDDGSGEETAQTNNGYGFTLGSGAALDGFEDAVIGMKVNDVKDISITFPAEYPTNPEYAGKVGVFETKLVKLYEPPELTDDMCYEFGSYPPNKELFLEDVKNKIIYSYIQDYLLENAELLSKPEKEYNEYYNGFIDSFKKYAKSNSKTLEEYVTQNGENHPSAGLYAGITMDEFYAIARRYADDNLKNDLVMYYIIQLEGLKPSGPLYEEAKRELLKGIGVGAGEDDIKKLEKKYGKTQVITSIMDIQVQKALLKYATVTE